MSVEDRYRSVRTVIRLRDWMQQRPTADYLSPFERLVMRARIQEHITKRRRWLR